jgi:isopropylmalate/homocitrate/citramalate synthase
VQLFVRRTRERLGVPLETHFHMDFGLGVANTLIAIAEGVEVIQTTVTGIGERAGNTPMEETVLALLTMYGLDTGIRTERFTELSKLVMQIAGVSQPSNRPVVGERLYNVESGIITTWVRNVGDELTESFPYRPELVGQPAPVLVLGKGSGIDSVAAALERLGLTATDEQALAILDEVKARSLETKGLVDDEAFSEIVQRVTS